MFKETINKLERHQKRPSGVFMVNCGYISHRFIIVSIVEFDS